MRRVYLIGLLLGTFMDSPQPAVAAVKPWPATCDYTRALAALTPVLHPSRVWKDIAVASHDGCVIYLTILAQGDRAATFVKVCEHHRQVTGMASISDGAQGCT